MHGRRRQQLAADVAVEVAAAAAAAVAAAREGDEVPKDRRICHREARPHSLDDVADLPAM